jgi:hypothetical protein
LKEFLHWKAVTDRGKEMQKDQYFCSKSCLWFANDVPLFSSSIFHSWAKRQEFNGRHVRPRASTNLNRHWHTGEGETVDSILRFEQCARSASFGIVEHNFVIPRNGSNEVCWFMHAKERMFGVQKESMLLGAELPKSSQLHWLLFLKYERIC